MTPRDMAATHSAAFHPARSWRAEEFAALLDNRFCQVFGDRDCFALIRVIADEAELLTIATHPGQRRRGLARACMTRWHQAAAEQGAGRAFLDVAADNPAAQQLYTSCGYAICGRRAGYYARETGPAVDALLMTCTLTP